MAWIESHQSLRGHPKVLKAARLLGVNPYQLIGHLQALWWWALDYAEDGILTDYEDDSIAAAAGWDGDAGPFVLALIEAGSGTKKGFIDRDSAGQRLHDWPDYAGKLIARRRHNAEQMRLARASIKEERVQHVVNTSTPRDETVTRECRPTVPTNRTGPDQPETVSSHEETAPNGARSFRAVLDVAKAELEGPKPNTPGVLIRVFQDVYGRKPSGGFMAALLRDYDAPYEMCCLMVELVADWNGTDDAQKFLAGALRSRKEKTRNGLGRGPPSGYMTDAEAAESARINQEQLEDYRQKKDSHKWTNH